MIFGSLSNIWRYHSGTFYYNFTKLYREFYYNLRYYIGMVCYNLQHVTGKPYNLAIHRKTLLQFEI